MAATSPYSGNDYNAVSNFRPYELPVNDIFRALQAQNEFWEIGAKRVKSIYDNALNLDVTLDANKEVKKQFLDDAAKQLDKLSSMDLSDPSIQRQGLNIYKPLFEDKAMMYDSEITKTLKGIYGDANKYKSRKLSSTGREGEGYTDRNLAYSLDGFEAFNSKLQRDPDMLQGLYEKLGNRKYSPYYDSTKEFTGIQKLCKGSGGEKQDVASDYLYFDNLSKSGANSSETANCFMMGLSEQAKQQMGIDGWAYYKGNPALLAKDHYDYALGPQEQQLSGIKGQIAGIRTGGVTKEEEPLLKKLEDSLPAIQDAFDSRKKEYDQMIGGNALNYVTQNFQTLSKGIYLNKTYKALGEAYKSDDVSRKLTANAAGIAQYNALERSYQQQREHDYNMEEIKLRASLTRKLKQEAGEIPLDQVNPLNPPVTDANDTGQGYGEKDFNIEKSSAFKVYSDAYQSLGQYMLSQDPAKDPHGYTDSYLLNFANEQSKKAPEQQDKQFRELYQTYKATKDNFAEMDMRQKAINATVQNSHPELTNKITKASDGTELTLDEVARIQNGESVKGITQSVDVRRAYGSSGPGDKGGNVISYYKDGHQISMGQPIADLSKSMINLQSERDKLHRKAYYDAKNYVSPRINPEKMPGIDNQIKNILGVSGGNNEKNGYRLLGHDRTGKDLIVVPLDDNALETKPDFQRARSTNVNVTEEKIGTSIHAIRIPNIMDALPDSPSESQLKNINNLRNFSVLMEAQLKNKGAYYSSEDLKNKDGTTYPYPNFTFETERGNHVKVKAVVANGQTRLVPAVQIKGGWDTNYQSFATAEELILHFRNY